MKSNTLGKTVGQLIAFGMDPTVMQHATSAMRAGLTRRGCSIPSARVEAANTNAKDQRQRVRQATSRAVQLLDVADPTLRRRLVDLLDVSRDRGIRAALDLPRQGDGSLTLSPRRSRDGGGLPASSVRRRRSARPAKATGGCRVSRSPGDPDAGQLRRWPRCSVPSRRGRADSRDRRWLCRQRLKTGSPHRCVGTAMVSPLQQR